MNSDIETNAVIVLGDIKHLRRNRQSSYYRRRRRMARLLSGSQYYRLTQYIKYKAALAGIKVLEVSEARTSQTCKVWRTRTEKNTGTVPMRALPHRGKR